MGWMASTCVRFPCIKQLDVHTVQYCTYAKNLFHEPWTWPASCTCIVALWDKQFSWDKHRFAGRLTMCTLNIRYSTYCNVASRHKHSFVGCLASVTRHSPWHPPPWGTYKMKTLTAFIDVSSNFQVAPYGHCIMETFSTSWCKSPSCNKQYHLSCYILKMLSIICRQIGKMSCAVS